MRVLGWIGALWLAFAGGSAAAQGLIRDAEIERTLGRIAAPIFRAAMLNPASVRLYIVNDREPNAFVAGGQRMFLHTGMLTQLETIDQLRAVIAHETGHIAGGHIARRGWSCRARAASRWSACSGPRRRRSAAARRRASPSPPARAGGGAQRAGAQPRRGGERRPGGPALHGGGRRRPRAMLEVLRRFRGQEMLLGARQDAYARAIRSGPSAWRCIEERVAALPPGRRALGRGRYWHRRMVAKFDAFLESPGRDPARLSRERRLRGRDAVARGGLSPPAGRGPRAGRGRRADRAPAGRCLLPRAQGPDPARVRPRHRGGGRLSRGRPRSRRTSR